VSEPPYDAIAAKARMTDEVRKARNLLLGVALFMFGKDLYTAWDVHRDDWPEEMKRGVTLIAGIIVSYRLVLWWFARYRPRLCLSLALVGLWGFYIWLAIANADPVWLYNAPLYKVLFTYALVQGIISASRAERLRKELGEVFG
jgi:hypothetical protein